MTPHQFLLLADALPEVLLLITTEGTIAAANTAAAKLLASPADALTGLALADLVDDPPDALEGQLRRWARSRRPLPAALQWRGPALPLRGWRCHGFLLHSGEDPTPGHLVLRCTPGRSPAKEFVALNRELESQRTTLRRLMESRDALALEHERAHVTLHSIGDAVITTDADGHVDYLNPVASQLTGWQLAEAVGEPLVRVFDIVNEITGEPALDPVARCLAEGRTVGLANHTMLISRDGTEYIIEDSAAPIRNRHGDIFGAVLVFHDVTGDRLARRQLEYLAQHDTLTGLHNRHYFEQQLEQAVHLSRRGQRTHAMFYLDLDQFKLINDTAGHSIGDELLVEVARLFARRVRQGDVLARLGGDEFGVLLNDVDGDHASRIANDLIDAMNGFRFTRDGMTYEVTSSIGIAVIDENTVSPAEALRHADIACYVAKRMGRNCTHLYSAQDEADMAAVGEMNLVNEIKEALAQDRFALYFQPIVRLTDGEVLFHEVLLRMVERTGELRSPAMFISAAERYGLMPQIDRWVVWHVLQLLRRLDEEGRNTHITVNLSGASMSDPDTLAFIKAQLEENGGDGSSLVFEVTETAAVAHIERAGTFMRELSAMGCRFALDDFGTGFSSFAYLKYLPVDFLKIDGTFIRDMVNDEVDQAMVLSINQIAHSLGKETIAEFVESSDILEELKRIGVDMVQGYHIGRLDSRLSTMPN